MNIIYFIIALCTGFAIMAVSIAIRDEQRIKDEAEIRRCTMTECFFNDDLLCRSLTDTWNPYLLDNCPDYTED